MNVKRIVRIPVKIPVESHARIPVKGPCGGEGCWQLHPGIVRCEEKVYASEEAPAMFMGTRLFLLADASR